MWMMNDDACLFRRQGLVLHNLFSLYNSFRNLNLSFFLNEYWDYNILYQNVVCASTLAGIR